jgi:hypothetical protein
MDRRTDTTKPTVVFCNFTNAPEKIFQKDGDKMWVEFKADSMAQCQVVTETVLYKFSDLLSHLFIYSLMVYFMALLGAQAL